ncbi:MAG: TIGR00341 family protein [Propionicimonas sp.]|uniref:TIGR00341 family protein n=1 Tax=Propionicimonas sp. TaxID=1955623 RepID=UPI003D09D9B6
MSGLLTRVTAEDVERMMSRLLLTEGDDRQRKLSAFWVLIILATVIASAGVMADSTATVIGAMIVAPLMTPILGTALSVVLSRRRLILVNLGMVVAGAACVVAIAFLLGMTNQVHLVADTNSQIAARVTPRLIDLLAALATGVVGAFAMVRSDISDTLPGVAIAISLVPPLAVVGLTLESGAPEQALGALLLFGTNVTAIIATGTVVFLAYGVRRAAIELHTDVGRLRAGTLAVVIGAVLLLTVPLGIGSAVVVQQELITARAAPVAKEWAEAQGWQIQDISVRQGTLHIVALGPPPTIQDAGLRDRLDAAGLRSVDVRVTLVLGGSVVLSGGR